LPFAGAGEVVEDAALERTMGSGTIRWTYDGCGW
jgi:hypothetical protein